VEEEEDLTHVRVQDHVADITHVVQEAGQDLTEDRLGLGLAPVQTARVGLGLVTDVVIPAKAPAGKLTGINRRTAIVHGPGPDLVAGHAIDVSR